MIKKQISKISMFASLLVATMVNAQEFYTCVPKKSWWKDIMTESVEKGIDRTKVKKWILVEEFYVGSDKPFPLNSGKYKLEYIAENTNGEHEFIASDNQYIKTTFKEGESIVSPTVWIISTPNKDIELHGDFVSVKLYKLNKI